MLRDFRAESVRTMVVMGRVTSYVMSREISRCGLGCSSPQRGQSTPIRFHHEDGEEDVMSAVRPGGARPAGLSVSSMIRR